MCDLREINRSFVMIKCASLGVYMYVGMEERGYKSTPKSFLEKILKVRKTSIPWQRKERVQIKVGS